MEWVCRQHDARQSATTRPASGGEERAVSDHALPPEERSTHNGLKELDLEALMREACEIVKSKIEAEEGFIAWIGGCEGPSGSEDAEEEASLRVEDGGGLCGGRKSVRRRHGRGCGVSDPRLWR